MNRHFFIVLILAWVMPLMAQPKISTIHGFRHVELSYKGERVDFLVKSKEGEESLPKPLFFFCQGSLPQPLLKTSPEGLYGVFPFNEDSLLTEYHVVIVSKPAIPLEVEVSRLWPNFIYLDSLTKNFPTAYAERNHLDYYVKRNNAIIKWLCKQTWVSHKRLVVAGHSEGSTIAAKLALTNHAVTHLIYSGGNPMGRILSIIQQGRFFDTDTTQMAEEEYKYWEDVVAHKNSTDTSQGDTPKTTYSFSIPPIQYLRKVKCPILVTYGTADWCAPYNDYMRVDCIQRHKKNFTFKAYQGLEHNFFPLLANHQPNYDIFNWDNILADWRTWLEAN